MKSISNIASSGSSGGGHSIEDSTGTELTQRNTLQVKGSLIAQDDSINEKTIITDGQVEIDYEDWMELTPEEQAAIPKALILNAPDPSSGGGDNITYEDVTVTFSSINPQSDAQATASAYTNPGTPFGYCVIATTNRWLGAGFAEYDPATRKCHIMNLASAAISGTITIRVYFK